jgi:hypothetical protein
LACAGTDPRDDDSNSGRRNPYPTPTRDGREPIPRTGSCPTDYVGKGNFCEALHQDTPRATPRSMANYFVDCHKANRDLSEEGDEAEPSNPVRTEMSVRGDEAIVLAGLNYRRHLEMALLDRFAEVDVPMSGLMLGQQLSWLSKKLKED